MPVQAGPISIAFSFMFRSRLADCNAGAEGRYAASLTNREILSGALGDAAETAEQSAKQEFSRHILWREHSPWGMVWHTQPSGALAVRRG
jgi:hypothetical protein